MAGRPSTRSPVISQRFDRDHDHDRDRDRDRDHDRDHDHDLDLRDYVDVVTSPR
jgi:hypothetical protein